MLQIDRDGHDQIVLTVAGEIDLNNAVELADAVICALEGSQVQGVEVNLSGVTFMDSAGLRALVTGWRTATTGQKSFVVSQPRDNVRRVFEITGLSAMLGLDEEA